MCRVLEVSRSGFYKWERHVPSSREENNTALIKEIQKLFKEHRERIGSPKMKHELAENGIKAGKNRIAGFMRSQGLRAKTHRKFRAMTTNSKHTLPIAENLLNRQFSVSKPNQVWVTDITYVRVGARWMYLTVFIDLYSRSIVGWAISSSLDTLMVLMAFNRAVRSRRPGAGLMIHSDRGCQYASELFRDALKRHRFIQSMSRKGNCWDNAVAESFFRIYKTELAYHCNFVNEADAIHKTFEYIECYYNGKRRHGTLGYLTPNEFENQFRKAA